MFGGLGRRISDWHEPAMQPPEPVRAGRERDILAEERVAKRGWFAALRGGGPLAGWRLVAGAALLAGLGLAFTVVGNGEGSQSGSGGELAPPNAVNPGQGPDFEAALTGADYGAAVGYGRVVGRGAGGRPAVAHEASGEVRELTVVEIEFGRGDVVQEVAGKDGAVWNPGPRGLGLWWREPETETQAAAVQPILRFPREAWRQRQQGELNYALNLLDPALTLVESQLAGESGPGPWSEDARRVVSEPLALLRARHEPAVWGKWASVPAQWECDFTLERDLSQGVTVGCPLSESHAALAEAWVSVGRLAEELDKLGKIETAWAGLSGRETFSSNWGGERLYTIYDIAVALGNLDAVLLELFLVTEKEHLPLWAVAF